MSPKNNRKRRGASRPSRSLVGDAENDDDDDEDGSQACQDAPMQEAMVSMEDSAAQYKAGEYCCARDRFLARARQHLKVSYKTACDLWNSSTEKKNYLKNMSVGELKRRRFVPKGTTENPFL